jgi:hypothetical protein
MSLNKIIKKFFMCINCNKGEFQYNHLEPGKNWGPWHCSNCGVSFRGSIDMSGEPIVERTSEGIDEPVLVLLRLCLPLSDGSIVHAIIKAVNYGGKAIDESHQEYFYNEGTCPTNWMSEIDTIIENQNVDPHGIFQWVSTITMPKEWDSSNKGFDWFCEHFPELKSVSKVPILEKDK